MKIFNKPVTNAGATYEQDKAELAELSSSEIVDVAAGAPENTCVQSCEHVEGTSIIVCSPVICF